MAEGQPAAEGDDRHLAERRKRLEQWLVAGLQSHGAHLGAVQLLGAAGQAFDLPFLLAESLDHPHAAHRLVDDARHLARLLLGVPGGGEDLVAHTQRDQAHHRDDDERHGGQQG